MEKTCCFASLCVVHIAQAHKPNREDGHRLGHQQQHPIQWFRISVCFCGVYQEYIWTAVHDVVCFIDWARLFYVIKFNANMWLLAIAYRWEITALMIVVPINSIYCFFSAHFIAKNEQIHMSVPCWALWDVTHSILTTLNWQSFISTQMTAHDDNDAWSELCVNSSTNDSIRLRWDQYEC